MSKTARILRPFEYREPQSISEAVGLLSQLGERASVLAGGTDLLVSMKRGRIRPEYIICINNIREMDYIGTDGDGTLRIGALTSHQAIARSSLIQERFPFLATACGKIGGFQVRHMGTIGGNISQAGPSQDSLPSLLVLEARVKLASAEGERVVSLQDFLIGPFQTARRSNEILTEIILPAAPRGSKGCYVWVTKNTRADETLVGVALILSLEQDATVREGRIGLGSVAPTAIRAKRTEAMLQGRRLEASLAREAARAAAEETSPRSQVEYRKTLTRELVERAMSRLYGEITGSPDQLTADGGR